MKDSNDTGIEKKTITQIQDLENQDKNAFEEENAEYAGEEITVKMLY